MTEYLRLKRMVNNGWVVEAHGKESFGCLYVKLSYGNSAVTVMATTRVAERILAYAAKKGQVA